MLVKTPSRASITPRKAPQGSLNTSACFSTLSGSSPGEIHLPALWELSVSFSDTLHFGAFLKSTPRMSGKACRGRQSGRQRTALTSWADL